MDNEFSRAKHGCSFGSRFAVNQSFTFCGNKLLRIEHFHTYKLISETNTKQNKKKHFLNFFAEKHFRGFWPKTFHLPLK